MTVEDLRMLVDYHYWARDRMFEALAPLTAEQFTRHVANSFPSIRETVVHLYTADWGWHLLWQGLPLTQPPSVDSFPDLASVQTVWQDSQDMIIFYKERSAMESLQAIASAP